MDQVLPKVWKIVSENNGSSHSTDVEDRVEDRQLKQWIKSFHRCGRSSVKTMDQVIPQIESQGNAVGVKQREDGHHEGTEPRADCPAVNNVSLRDSHGDYLPPTYQISHFTSCWRSFSLCPDSKNFDNVKFFRRKRARSSLVPTQTSSKAFWNVHGPIHWIDNRITYVMAPLTANQLMKYPP
ncbi:hypothetical protein RRG08_042289 [Elysia crispata]|uniref:Uncharacterized protein n=1 Tax=Elysia crispata TaxID=231223 RepID=A0AAE1AIS3_9GAST|nr:hypothetical protein RRG08_042289 [Elysia crispata]